MLHPPVFIPGLQDFTMMSEAIQHGSGHFPAPEDPGPFPKVQIGGDDDRGLLIEL